MPVVVASFDDQDIPGLGGREGTAIADPSLPPGADRQCRSVNARTFVERLNRRWQEAFLNQVSKSCRFDIGQETDRLSHRTFAISH